MYTGTESGLVINIKHAAHRLVQHTLQVMEIAWIDDNTLANFFFICYGWFNRAAVISMSEEIGIK